MAGNWTLSKFVRQNAEQSLQSNYKVTLRWVSKQELRINIRIVNGVGTIARVNENDNRILEVEPLFSTMMAGPPEMMKDERNLSAALASLTAFQESGDQLLLNGNDFELHLSRYKEQFEPYTKDVTVAE